MTIWLLALIFLASLAGLGYRQGAIRVSISFFGILFGALLAVPLGRLLKPVVSLFGVKDPVLLWVIPPVIMFFLISIVFKAVAATIHHKVDVYYKYRAGDLRLALWERLNQRLGLCVGLLNAVAYIVIICWAIYPFGYWTVQVSSGDQDPRGMRLLIRLANDLQSSGMIRVAKAVDGISTTFYDAADITGLIYNNSLLEARLGSYPAFLGLAETPEFQSLAGDRQFIEMRQRGEPIKSLMSQPQLQSILQNPDLLRKIWGIFIPDLHDLRAYLETGKSAKYDPETILGRWRYNVGAAVSAIARAKPNVSSSEMKKIKKAMVAYYDKTSCVGMTDGQIVLKNVPQMKMPAGGPVTMPTLETIKCTWKNLGPNRYQLTVSGKDMNATIEGDKLWIKGEGLDLVFSRES